MLSVTLVYNALHALALAGCPGGGLDRNTILQRKSEGSFTSSGTAFCYTCSAIPERVRRALSEKQDARVIVTCDRLTSYSRSDESKRVSRARVSKEPMSKSHPSN
eukprot:1182608-Prorocentrum_minimum.AAC.5